MKIPRRYGWTMDTLRPRNGEQERCVSLLRKIYDWERWARFERLKRLYDTDLSLGSFPADLGERDEFELYKAERERIFADHEAGPWSLSLLGSVGNGKTTMACALLNTYNSIHGKGARYAPLGELMDEYKARFDGEVLRGYMSCPLLVVDEISEADLTSYALSILRRIIDARYGEYRRTVFIANMTPAEFSAALGGDGGSAVSRLREGLTFAMTAPDMRGRLASEFSAGGSG